MENENTSPDLLKIVEESKINLANDTQINQKKRGRPKKVIQEVSKAQDVPSPSINSEVPDLKPMLKPIVKLPFLAMAEKSKFEGWKLLDDEADAIAECTQNVINHYMPQAMNSPHAPLIIACMTIGVICTQKYVAEREFSLPKKIENKENENKPANVEVINIGGS